MNFNNLNEPHIAQLNNLKDVHLALETWEDEVKKQEEITVSGTQHDPTKKANVAEIVPEELATHSTLNTVE